MSPTHENIDVIEINEAFAAQILGCLKELNWKFNQINPHGSVISLGHPIGYTGAKLVVTTMYDIMI